MYCDIFIRYLIWFIKDVRFVLKKIKRRDFWVVKIYLYVLKLFVLVCYVYSSYLGEYYGIKLFIFSFKFM